MPKLIALRTAHRRNRLSPQDISQAKAWAGGSARHWCRIEICADPSEDERIGDFVSIYRLHDPFASWGAARRGTRILLWRSDFGTDIGYFARMSEALGSVYVSYPDHFAEFA